MCREWEPGGNDNSQHCDRQCCDVRCISQGEQGLAVVLESHSELLFEVGLCDECVCGRSLYYLQQLQISSSSEKLQELSDELLWTESAEKRVFAT